MSEQERAPMTDRQFDDLIDHGLDEFYRVVTGRAEELPSSSPPRSSAPRLPERLENLEIGDVIGSGGMGVVVRAFDPQLRRHVAVKILRKRFDHNRELVRRFLEEAVVSSQLQHPGIVPIYAFGHTDDDRPFYSMKIVEGETLKQHIDEGALSRAGCIEVFARVCETVAFAHARGVVHGDLKPANVMVGAFGEVQVLDWGFAKAMSGLANAMGGRDRDPALRIVGTPAYMAPEQARGDLEAIDQQTDVFGLGGILCEILTGVPTHAGGMTDEVLLRATSGCLDDLHRRLDAADVDGALADVARACLVVEKDGRLADAGEVSRRVSSYIADVEQRARTLEIAAAEERARATQERRARRLSVALSVVVVTAVLGLAAAFAWIEREHRVSAAERERMFGAASERTRLLVAKARANPGDRLGWQQALVAAQQSETVARAGDVDPLLQARAMALVSDVRDEQAAALRDADMRAELESIRLDGADHVDADRDSGYEEAFAAYDLPLADLAVPIAAERVERSRIREALVFALDEWGVIRHRRGTPADVRFARRLFEVSQRADPNPWRHRLRDAVLAGDAATLRQLARSAELEEAPVPGLLLLGAVLANDEERSLAVNVFRHARLRWPSDFWVQHNLAAQLVAKNKGIDDEVIGLSWSCVALRPDSPHAWTDLGIRLHATKDRSLAPVALERAIQLDPGCFRAEIALARMCCADGDRERGLAALQRAEQLAEGDPERLLSVGKSYEYDAFYPRLALDVHRRAARIQRTGLRGRFTRTGYVNSLMRHGRFAEAIRELEAGLDLDPTCRQSLILLGEAKVLRGDFTEAVVVFDRGATLGDTDPSRHWVAWGDYARRLASAAENLRTHSDHLPNDAGELILSARAALYGGLPHLAMRLFTRAFELDPDMAETPSAGHTPEFDAACAAARVAVGRGVDIPSSEREAASAQARVWLARSLRELERAARIDSHNPNLRFRIVEHFGLDEFEPFREAGDDEPEWRDLWLDFDRFRAGLRLDR